MKHAIQECYEVDEIKLIRDKTEAYRYALIQAKQSPEYIRKAEEIKLRAERRAGELLKDQVREPGETNKKIISQATILCPTLPDLNITPNQSANWQKIAGIPEETFEEYLHTSKEITTSGAIRIAQKTERENIPTPALLKGKYNIIYADPPWQYWEGGRKNQSQHYSTMTFDEIAKIPVQELSADNCILFLWATRVILPEAIMLIKEWGFNYSTVGFVWVKSKKDGTGFAIGLGDWTRANAEYCLIGLKGTIARKDKAISEIIYLPREQHSRKPAIVRELITQLVGNLPRIELFATEKTKGWETWGKREL